jgi:hypothetical protein
LSPQRGDLAYGDLVVEAYDPVHPQVQEAAGVLIHILIEKGDLFDAQHYAQVTYGYLRYKKNGIDQESDVVAGGAYKLADVIYRIKSLIYDINHLRVRFQLSFETTVLNLEQEQLQQVQLLLAKAYYEESHRIRFKIYGPTHQETVKATSQLARVYALTDSV